MHPVGSYCTHVVRVIGLMRDNSNLPFKMCVRACVRGTCISDKPHHSLLSPFRMTAGNTLIAAVPVCQESVSCGLVQCIAVDIRFLSYTVRQLYNATDFILTKIEVPTMMQCMPSMCPNFICNLATPQHAPH